MAAKRLVQLVVGGMVLAAAAVALPNLWVAHATHLRTYGTLEDVPQRSVAIVPGTSVYGGQPGWCSTDRLKAALALYRAGRVKAIVVSGNDTQASPEVSVMRSWLMERGVPAADVWSDPAGSRTRETMLNATRVFGVKDAIICTQDLYVQRTLFLASQAGLDAVGVGLPTGLSRSSRLVGVEALKTTLAFAESYLRAGPDVARTPSRTSSALLAVR
jgi:SanA protein